MPSIHAPAPDWKTFFGRYRMPAVFILLGALSIGMLLWTTRLTDRQGLEFNFVDALIDMKAHASTSHLWFERSYYGHIDENMEAVWQSLEEAISLSRVMINGGKTEYGLQLKPLEPSLLRSQTEEIHSLLLKLKEISLDQYRHPETAGIDSPLEKEYDSTFIRLLKLADDVEFAREKELTSSQEDLRRLSGVLLLAWVLVVAAATAGLWSRERRRADAEEALRRTNEQLQAQAGELRLHREHLLELVEARTGELTAANEELQREVTERRKALVALEESRDKFEKLSTEFHTLLDAIPDALTLLSPELKIVWANRGAAAMFGRPISSLIGEPCRELWNGGILPENDHPAAQAFHREKVESVQIQAPDGTIRDTRVFPILDGRKNIRNVIEVATDVTEKLMIQAEAQRIAHLASLGELAAGVAHEINNPISGIINYAQVLLDIGNQTEEDAEILQQIMSEGDRIANIVSSLLSFARESRTQKTSVDLHEVFSEVVALCGRQIERDGILLSLDIPETIPRIHANHHQIEQVFLNLMSNARYALNQKYPSSAPEKRLTITAEEIGIDDLRHVAITFHDRGTGIPADLLGRVMDPFFSTKPKGYGTGLGLSISHGIVTDHGGRFLLRSVQDEYTTVEVILPVGVMSDA